MNLVFEEIRSLEDNKSFLFFRNYLKPNFLNCELKIALIVDTIDYLDFYSNRFGIARFNCDSRDFTANSWEKEDYVQGLSELSKHYTSINLNSYEDSYFALEKIIPDVQFYADTDLKDFLNKVLNEPIKSINGFTFIHKILQK
ncbi:MAG: hypothetical protein MH321_01400 [Leptospiraceae bacterium]|nr:hypothetical protein [Leptospiraceae bacterium]